MNIEPQYRVLQGSWMKAILNFTWVPRNIMEGKRSGPWVFWGPIWADSPWSSWMTPTKTYFWEGNSSFSWKGPPIHPPFISRGICTKVWAQWGTAAIRRPCWSAHGWGWTPLCPTCSSREAEQICYSPTWPSWWDKKLLAGIYRQDHFVIWGTLSWSCPLAQPPVEYLCFGALLLYRWTFLICIMYIYIIHINQKVID